MSPTPYYDEGGITIYHGDCRDVLPALRGADISAAVTSPPYWRQRIYGEQNGHGQEESPSEYVAEMTALLGALRDCIAEDGALWLNVGDKYAESGLGGGGSLGGRKAWAGIAGRHGYRNPPPGYKPKDLTLIPFHLADSLRRDGWYLRQTIVWAKPAAVEPTRPDRPSTAHEYVFLLSVSEQSSVKDPGQPWWLNSVWQMRSDSDGSHPAPMPTVLAKRCILASTRPGGLVIDPFMGSGTTLRSAADLNRRAIGIEIEERFCEMAVARLGQEVFDFGEAA